MFLWPIYKFWTFSPLGFLLAIAWNLCELFHISLPMAGEVFGIITGRKGKKISQ
jgi:hypothetical protein